VEPQIEIKRSVCANVSREENIKRSVI
jgi:hypothetical protein